jgi:indole-3-glycerol phosphate synthase
VNTILDRIVATKRDEIAVRRREMPVERLAQEPGPQPRRLSSALSATGVSIIAEIKRRSPSKGPLRENIDAAALARDYELAGARALSVLTDGPYFGGCDADLRQARAATSLPVLRKDFTIDPYQIYEARHLGADAILLIVRLLEPDRLREMLALSRELGLEVLVEVHSQPELNTAIECGAAIVGVNSRDLTTFETDLGVALRLRESIPDDRISVAESGIRCAADVEGLRVAGFDGCLVGESLITADNPGDALRRLRGERES